MPRGLTEQERQALREMTNERRTAAEQSLKATGHKAPSTETSANSNNDFVSMPNVNPIAASKRKSTEANLDPDDINVEDMPMDKSCNQVRGQIRRFLDSGEMKVGEFCKALGVSNKSLNDFLRQSGPMKGAGSATYDEAWAFFKRRELAGVKMPTKKAKTNSGGAEAGSSSKTPEIDISGIHLDGEDAGNVAVYETCDEVRKKVNAHLKKPGVTQAAFCRELTEQLHGTGKVSTAQLTTFRSKKGPTAGATSNVFYGAYTFFEKIRLAENKSKSRHRLNMEEAWPNGFDLEHDANTGYLCHASERIHVDSLGRVSFHKIGGAL